MKISWKYAKVLLQFQNGVGPWDSSNIMLRSQKNVAAVCCAFHTHWSEVWKQVCCNYFKYKCKKNWRSTGLTYRQLWGYFGAINIRCRYQKCAERTKNWLWRWLTVFDKHMILQHMISARQAKELFDKLRKTSFAISTSQTDCLLVETTSDQKLVYLWRRVFSDTKIYFRKGPRPDSCGFWFLNYITVTAVEVVFTMVVVGISTLHERVLGNVYCIRGLFALHLIVLW